MEKHRDKYKNTVKEGRQVIPGTFNNYSEKIKMWWSWDSDEFDIIVNKF